MKIDITIRRTFKNGEVIDQQTLDIERGKSEYEKDMLKEVASQIYNILDVFETYESIVKECQGEGLLKNKKLQTQVQDLIITTHLYPVKGRWNLYLKINAHL